MGNYLRLDTSGEENYSPWYVYGVVVLASGDYSRYQEICAMMTDRFTRRGCGDEVAVRLSLLSPQSGVPISKLRRLLPQVSLISPRSEFLCWYVLSNGLFEYRAGRALEAVKILKTMQTENFAPALASGASVQAMAFAEVGNLEAARTQLEHARAILNSPVVPRKVIEQDWWRDKIAAEILFREAEQLLSSKE
jgi:hypothetical protein